MSALPPAYRLRTVLLASAIAITAADAAWAGVCLATGLAYADVSFWISVVAYLAAGWAGTRAGGLSLGVLAGAVTSMVDNSAGTAVAWWIGPGRLSGGWPGFAEMVAVFAVSVALGALLGMAGGALALFAFRLSGDGTAAPPAGRVAS